MRTIIFIIVTILATSLLSAQDYYGKARKNFNKDELDSARYYINKNLVRKPTAEDYFLSALIHESQDAPLRALADYEAVIQKDPDNLDAYFEKGLIYFNSASHSKAIEDFTHVIDHIDQSQTRAVYFGNDPNGVEGTFITTLQSFKGRMYQYRGLAYKNVGEGDKALQDFEASLQYDSTANVFINRSQLYSRMGKDALAIDDLKTAVSLDPDSYLAWYNLALLDESAKLPDQLLQDDSFSPMLNLLGANAYVSQEYKLSVKYYTKSIENDADADLALIGRGKAFLKLGSYGQARADFIKALQLNPERTESFFLIGNSFFYEGDHENAIGFYEQYLSINPFYENIWYNSAMSYLSIDEGEKACTYLKKAANLGMAEAEKMLAKHCDSQ